ncbi:MAG: teichoic acid transporter, partial [Candidatus Binatia bacterium]|nr:teichoic acid transporter [Candidatus Binatia bacterium]
ALVMLSVATTILLAAGKPGWTLAITASLVPLAAIGHLLLIPLFGALGAVLVTTVCAHLGALVAMAAVYALWRIWPPLATVGRSLLICAAAFALTALWPTAGLLLVIKLTGVVVFIGCAFFALGELGARDIAFLRSLAEWRAMPQERSESTS